MASFLNKWLFISIFSLVFQYPLTIDTISKLVNSCSVEERLHPFHVSVVEINHNAADKTLEISCKLFTDDFEKVLAQNYPQDAAHKTKVDLTKPPETKAMDTLVKKYILSHLSIMADAKPLALSYLGFERDNDATLSYVEAENIPAVKKFEITNKLMHDMFTDQINIMHVIVNGERKSTKLDYPATVAKIEF